MAYYKLVSGGAVVDVIDEAAALWIVEDIQSLSLYSGKRENAWGVQATGESTLWHLNGLPAFHDYPDVPTVTLEEIGEGEYTALLAELEAGRIVEMENEPEPDTGQPDEKPEAKTIIQQLREQIAALQETNNMLTECLLEMSEVVYSE
jgi:hypothetical protein